MGERLDRALVTRGLVASRARAQALVAAGAVTVAGVVAAKPSAPVGPEAAIAVAGDPMPYVSRGGLKLVHALEVFGLSPAGRVCLDLGASTGGFTQVLLERGAREVWAVDVGHGQLDPGLVTDRRVRALEGVNARALAPGQVAVPEAVTADLSFISLAKALPAALGLARPGAWLVALVKPQFEVGRALVGKGGIVRDEGARARARAGVASFLAGEGWQVIGEVESPVPGGDGNREWLVAAEKPGARRGASTPA
jgi:23S rRNA (cytidine1920-2'-O)/16S rRNA (cytidine1409-2'-O)-methyltransferase